MSRAGISFSQFFDRPAVTGAVKKSKRRLLNKAGGVTRTIVRRSMRSAGKKGRVSSPGQPPRYHASSGNRYKDTIFYGYDARTESVVVGPSERFNRAGRGVVPTLLEQGGTVRRRGGTRRRPGKARTYRYKKRPHMAPGLEKAKDKYADLWKNGLRT